MVKRSICWIVLVIASALVFACEPEKLDRGKEMAVEAERHKVKRITQDDMEAWALAAGDTVVGLIEGAFLQLAEGQPKEQGLFVSNPEKLPVVQSILQRYNARLERKTFANDGAAQKFLTASAFQERNGLYRPKVTLEVAQQEFVFQKPIQIRRRNCASCEEPSMVDFTARQIDQLRAVSAQGSPEGFQIGQTRGSWVLYFPRKKLIEQITLKTKVSRRGHLLEASPDSVTSKK